jgi:hypothetical protein
MEKAWVQQRKDENQQDQKDERREQPYVVEDIFFDYQACWEIKKGGGIWSKIPRIA